MPERVQLSRQRGWRKPENTVVVSRPTKWGNPFTVGSGEAGCSSRESAVRMFKVHAVGVAPWKPDLIRAELAGKNLACWCPLDQPCHADVLLELANAPYEVPPVA